MYLAKRLMQAAVVTLLLLPFALDARAEAVQPELDPSDAVTQVDPFANVFADVDPLLEPFLFVYLHPEQVPSDAIAGGGKKGDGKKGDGKKRRKKDGEDADEGDEDKKKRKRRKKRRKRKRKKKKGDEDES